MILHWQSTFLGTGGLFCCVASSNISFGVTVSDASRGFRQELYQPKSGTFIIWMAQESESTTSPRCLIRRTEFMMIKNG
jgi:hypothetical protein